MIKPYFRNINRNRNYGVRVGDTVQIKMYDNKIGIVVERGFTDNNKVYVVFEGETEVRGVVAEWCTITGPVENKGESVCVILKQGDKILGVSRKHDHNDMGLPGGKVDPGETPDEAIVREVKEETGFTLTNLCLFYSEFYDGRSAHCYVADYSGEINYDKEKEGRVDWISQDELFNGSFGDYNKRALDYLSALS